MKTDYQLSKESGRGDKAQISDTYRIEIIVSGIKSKTRAFELKEDLIYTFLKHKHAGLEFEEREAPILNEKTGYYTHSVFDDY